jgi:FKBP-type peptidyl-prolyl cis-trans isomerase
MLHRSLAAALATALAALASPAPALAALEGPQPPPGSPAAAPPPPPKGKDLDNALYSTGLSISDNLAPFTLSPAELNQVIQGIKDGVAKKPKFPYDEKAAKSVQVLVRSRLAATADKEKGRSGEFLRKAAAEPGAIKTASGLVITHQKMGAGPQPGASDRVKVHYVGKLTDGKEFDSSVKRGQPVDFLLSQVIGCWTEGVSLMRKGGKAKLVCPSELAYGPQGRPPTIPGNAVLVFDVELISFETPQPAAGPAGAPASPQK